MGSPHNFSVFRDGTIWTSGTRQSQSHQNAYQSGNSVSSRAEGIMTAAPQSRAHMDDYLSFPPSAFGPPFTSPTASQGNTYGAGFGVPSSSNNTLDRNLESSHTQDSGYFSTPTATFDPPFIGSDGDFLSFYHSHPSSIYHPIAGEMPDQRIPGNEDLSLLKGEQHPGVTDESYLYNTQSFVARKRSHSDLMLGTFVEDRPMKRSRSMRVHRDGMISGLNATKLSFPEIPPVPPTVPSTLTESQPSEHFALAKAAEISLNHNQTKAIRKWLDTVEDIDTYFYKDYEKVRALATLVEAQPDAVLEYIRKQFRHRPAKFAQPPQTLYSPTAHQFTARYSLRDINSHLNSGDLSLVENYVKACHKRRGQKDGRRSVNKGPYRCTFDNCGYQTKRVFDWRRHEENHEPQELWLCNACPRSDGQNPFLVHRKDKFQKHAQKSHPNLDPIEVLDSSKLDFKGDFDSHCPLCSYSAFMSWDERCQHIVMHFEDEIHAASKRPLKKSKESAMKVRRMDREHECSDMPSSDESSSSDDDCDDDQGGSNGQYDDRGGPTGGSGGGSGNLCGPSFYKGNFLGHTSQSGGTSKSFDAYTHSGSFTYRNTTKYCSVGSGDLFDPRARRGFNAPHLASMQERDSNYLPVFTNAIKHNTLAFRLLRDEKGYSGKEDLAKPSISSPIARLSSSRSAPRILGFGTHGAVDAVREVGTGRVYARKRSRPGKSSQEANFLRALSHPHIVGFITAYIENALLNLIITPVCEQNLGDFMKNFEQSGTNFERAHAWIGCLSSALAYIHSQRIRHADIKPQNILVQGSEVFISDFGISRLVSEPDSTSSSIGPCTPLYAPLEITEHLAHGRRADVFSLGCVLLELFTCFQGKNTQDLYHYLGFKKRKRTDQKPVAYCKVHEKVLEWISMMRQNAPPTIRHLWDICETMLSPKSESRPTAEDLLDKVRRVLVEGMIAPCPTCTYNPCKELVPFANAEGNHQPPQDLHVYQYFGGSCRPKLIAFGESAPSADSTCHSTREDINRLNNSGQARQLTHLPSNLPPNADFDSSTPKTSSQPSSDTERPPYSSDICAFSPSQTRPTSVSCRCALRKKRSSVVLGLFETLLECERSPDYPFSLPVTDIRDCGVLFEPPPAYHEASLFPVSASVPGPTNHCQPHTSSEPNHAAQVVEITDLGKDGAQFLQIGGHEVWHGQRPCPPRTLAHSLCHICGAPFVAPCANQRSGCSHIRCDECTAPPNNRRPRKADSDLRGLGSHLAPPAYSYPGLTTDILEEVSTGDPHEGLDSENTVLDLVISQNVGLGDIPRETFIRSSPSTFDRIHSADRSLSPISTSSRASSNIGVQNQSQPLGQQRHKPSSQTPTFSPSPTPSSPPTSKRVKADKQKGIHLHLLRNHSSPRATTKSHPLPEPTTCPMNDYNRNTALDSRDLTSRLNKIQKSHSTSNDGDYVSRLPRMQRTPSSESSGTFSRLPTFRKSPTSSTTGSDEVSRLEVIRTIPHPVTHRESVEVGAGEFSKPTIRKRRSSNESTKSQREFRYYGRHANTWLFNDFSVTDTVKKGWGKVFSGKNDGDAEKC